MISAMAGYTKILMLMMTLMVIGEMQVGSAEKCGSHGCPKGQCCSRWGYCGTTKPYCGDGCQSGPCINEPSGIESIATPEFFNRIKSGISNACKGKNFYTYDGFIEAAKFHGFNGFGTTGSLIVRKRELAAFFANMAHETASFCYVEEIKKGTYCKPSKQWPCKSGKEYYGRGPLQLTWNYNYGSAGKYLGLPLLTDPDMVSQRSDVAFKASLWYWMVNRRSCHNSMISPGGKGFSGTIRCINGGECGGYRPKAVQARVNYYKKFCGWLGVSPGPNLSC